MVVFDASSDTTNREFELVVSKDAKPVSAIMFAGKKLNEPIAWHGPIVMNTQAELRQTFNELRSGDFPPVRVSWDYKTISAKPASSSPVVTSCKQ